MAKPPQQRSSRSGGVNITSQLNPWHIDDGGVVFLHNNGIEVALQYWPPEASSVTTERLEAVEAMYIGMIEAFPYPKGRLRFLTCHRPARESEVVTLEYPPTNDPLQLALIEAEQEANANRVAEGTYKSHNTYIIIHIPDQRPGVTRSDQRPWNDFDREEMLLRAEDERDRLINMLNNVGIQAAPVMEEDAYGLQFSWYNQSYIADEVPTYDPELRLPEDVTLEQVRTDDAINIKTLRSQIVQSENLAQHNEYIRNGDALIVVADLKDYGDKGIPGSADKILGAFVNHTYWYVVDVVFGSESQIKARVERNTSAAVRAAIDSGKREDMVRAQKMEEETSAAYYGGQRWVRFGMSLSVVCRDEREVRMIRNTIRNQWEQEGKHIMTPGTWTNWDQFIYRLAPYSGMNTDFLHDQQANAVAIYLPYYGPWENTGGVTLAILENAYGTQQRITLPKSSEQAAHMAFVGTTRSGKSFTLQKLLMGFYMQGATLRIIDMKNDYEPLVRSLNGQFVPCYPGGLLPDGRPVRFNIFEGRSTGPMTTEERRDVVAFLKALIGEDLDLARNSLLIGAVNEYVESKTNRATNTYGGGTLGEFVEFLFTMRRLGNIGFDAAPVMGETAKVFATALQLFCTGVYGIMFNGPSTVELNNRVIVFDISQLGDDQNLTGAMMTLIRTNVWNAAKKRKDRRSRVIFVNEETGITGRIPEVKAGLQDMVMAGAAYNLLTIIVAQNATSIQALDGVLNNVSRIIMGRLESTEEVDLLAGLLEMNEEQSTSIRRLVRVNGQYNELFVREMKPDGVAQYGVVRYRPTDLEFALFDSSPEAKTRRDEIMAQHGDDQQTMLRIMVQERREALRR